MVYRKRSDKIDNPGPLLGVMRTCRQAMTDASATVKPMGTIYYGLGMVVSAIDALATLLTGRDGYFWDAGHGTTEAAVRQEKADRKSERPRPGAEELKTLITNVERPTEEP